MMSFLRGDRREFVPSVSVLRVTRACSSGRMLSAWQRELKWLRPSQRQSCPWQRRAFSRRGCPSQLCPPHTTQVSSTHELCCHGTVISSKVYQWKKSRCRKCSNPSGWEEHKVTLLLFYIFFIILTCLIGLLNVSHILYVVYK